MTMEVKSARAIARTVRVTPRKARLVVDLVRGKSVNEARAILVNTDKLVAPIVLKVLNSAAANATNNFNLDPERLYVSQAYVDEGIRMKRYMPRAKGSASGLVKRTCHITLVVSEK
jgi:large subunit ribosomal protein L22